MEYIMKPRARAIAPWVWWENAFIEEELDWLQFKAKNASYNAQVSGKSGNGVVDKDIRRSELSWLECVPDTAWVFERLDGIISEINQNYFNFDLFGFGEPIQLTNYKGNDLGMYGWHTDFNAGISRKISIVMQLTDPEKYEGGDLQLYTASGPISVRKKRGLIIAFPSYSFHQVTPVTSGDRQSLVSWISGPAFK